MSGNDSDHYPNDALTCLSAPESRLFDWLILEGAENDCTTWDDSDITQLRLDGLDIFLGCSTTDNPKHVAELAVFTECGAKWNERPAWDQLTHYVSVKPHGVWFDVTTSDRTHVWIVWSVSSEDICGPDLDSQMRRYIEFSRNLVDILESINWAE